MIAFARVMLARHRLRGHMFDRLVMGGSPDCPCARCSRDKGLLASLRKPWDDPTRAEWFRDLERARQRAGV